MFIVKTMTLGSEEHVDILLAYICKLTHKEESVLPLLQPTTRGELSMINVYRENHVVST